MAEMAGMDAASTARFSGVHELDFDRFHREFLAERLARGFGRLAACDVAGVGPLTLSLEDGRAFHYEAVAGDLAVREGAGPDGVVVRLAEAAFRDFVSDATSAPGLMYSGRAEFVRGTGADLMRWEPALRALYHGRPIFDAQAVDLRAADGSELDVTRTFTLDDDAAEMRHFFHEAGFLTLRAVLGPAEIRELRAESDLARAAMTPGDSRAWWGQRSDGTPVCSRVNYAGELSPRLQALFDDERMQRIAALSGERVRPATDRLDGVTVLFKTPEMAEGLSDLPWHIDCGMGGHSAMCPLLNLSIHLSDVSPENGDLRAIPGSHRGSNHPVYSAPGEQLGLSFGARAGDCTLHLGDLCHAAPPPTRPGSDTRRVSIILTYPSENLFEVVGPGQAYNDALLGNEGGQIDAIIGPSEAGPV